MRLTLLNLAFIFIVTGGSTEKIDFGNWTRTDNHDGYVLGDGKMYSIVGLGRELRRSGKSVLTGKPVTLTRIAWVIGPHYTLGNLGYGWDIIPRINNSPVSWQNEEICIPATDLPFWGVRSEHQDLVSEVTDLIIPGENVMLRRIVLTKPQGTPSRQIKIDMPVFPDPRNGFYGMFNGEEVKGEVIEKWKDRCGENLQFRESVPKDKLQLLFPGQNAIVQNGTSRALWQEVSTIVPDDGVYAILFPPRSLATTVICEEAEITADSAGFQIDLGNMEGGEKRIIGVWIVTVTGNKETITTKALQKLSEWRRKDVNEVIQYNRQKLPEPLITSYGSSNSDILRSINACADLVKATQANAGGVMAQPYTYPMYYVRDQYGSFKFLLSLGDFRSAYKILQFYVGMQNRDGIQNAHDCFIEPPDPTVWHPEANKKDGYWQRAEVPSYIILMARDYLQHTNDLEKIIPLYTRLAYNLRVQKFNKNNLLPWAHDESYTNSEQTRPKFGDEMTDSNILFLGAARFMIDLAGRLGKYDDSREFQLLHDQNQRAILDRLWLKDREYFAYARNTDNNNQNIDTRPALDALLRWTHLELGSREDKIAAGCLEAVIDNLINPIRVVPEVFDFTAGMDPGYLLYALSRFQHPALHRAAETLLQYASRAGLFSEYYRHQNGTIIPFGGTLRPWESSLCAQALIQYLLGLRIDMAQKTIYLQPHLPPTWDNWKTKKNELHREGFIQMGLMKTNDRYEFTIIRHGGLSELTVDLEFGGFGKLSPVPQNKPLLVTSGNDILSARFTLQPGKDDSNALTKTFRFNITN